MKKLTLILLVLATTLLIVGCQPAAVEPTEEELAFEVLEIEEVVEEEVVEEEAMEEEAMEEKVDSVVEGDGRVAEISMTARQFEFEPSTITVSEGDTVRLTVSSIDVDHGLAIPQFGVSEFLTPGEDVEITFVADKTGKYTFLCNVFCGSGHSGMKGTLIVE